MEQPMHKSTLMVYLIAANCVIGSFFFGYSVIYLNISLVTIETVLGIDESKKNTIEGVISALLSVGAGIGAFSSAILLMKFSRRQSFLITDLISIAGIFLQLIPNLITLCVARFIVGLGVGLNSALVPIYIKEYTPLQMRGKVGNLNQLTINIGILIAYFFGLGYPASYSSSEQPSSYWMIVFTFPAFILLIRILVMSFIFKNDPPRYYVSKGDDQKALSVLDKIYKPEYVEQQFSEIQRDESKSKKSQSYGQLFSSFYKRRLFVACLLSILQQLSGINAVNFYSTKIFEKITPNNNLAVQLLNIALGLSNILFSIVGGALMGRYGRYEHKQQNNIQRKQLLVVGDVMCCICLILLSVFTYFQTTSDNDIFKYLVIVFIFLYLLGFQFSLGPICWIYLADILPEKGVSIGALVNWVFASIVTLTFPILLDSIYIYGCFAIFAISCFLGIFLLVFMVKETKGKTAQSIDDLYSLNSRLLSN